MKTINIISMAVVMILVSGCASSRRQAPVPAIEKPIVVTSYVVLERAEQLAFRGADESVFYISNDGYVIPTKLSFSGGTIIK